MLSESALAELVAQAAGGDRFALGRLLIGHYDLIAERATQVIPELLAREVSVDDLVQQTFVAAIASIASYEHRSQPSFQAWLGTIAEHQAQNIVAKWHRRKRGGNVLPGAIPAGTDQSSWLALADLVNTSAATPSKRLAAHEAVQAMQVAVAELPDEQRKAVALHHLEGRSVEATAAELARTPGAVRGLLQRARRSLREALGNSSRWFDKKS